jgi:hypothetical protein
MWQVAHATVSSDDSCSSKNSAAEQDLARGERVLGRDLDLGERSR